MRPLPSASALELSAPNELDVLSEQFVIFDLDETRKKDSHLPQLLSNPTCPISNSAFLGLVGMWRSCGSWLKRRQSGFVLSDVGRSIGGAEQPRLRDSQPQAELQVPHPALIYSYPFVLP